MGNRSFFERLQIVVIGLTMGIYCGSITMKISRLDIFAFRCPVFGTMKIKSNICVDKWKKLAIMIGERTNVQAFVLFGRMIDMTTFLLTIEILAVFAAASLIAWGFWHEEKFIEFEELLFEAARAYIKRRRRMKAAAKKQSSKQIKLAKNNLQPVSYEPKVGPCVCNDTADCSGVA